MRGANEPDGETGYVARMRLEPIPPSDLDAEQRAAYDTIAAGIAATPGFETFVTKRDDGALLGPFNPWVHRPKIGEATWALFEAVSAASTLPARVREIVILVTGARFNSRYELYAHTAVALDVGLASDVVATLVAGQRPNDLSRDELLAYDAAACLAGGAILPQATYDGLVAAYGAGGASDLIYLVGLYGMVSMTLNGYDIPVPELQ